MTVQQPLILFGAGGHAKVLLSLIQAAGLNVLGICAPELVHQGIDSWRGCPVLSLTDDNLKAYSQDQVALVNGVGHQVRRQQLFEQFNAQGYHFPVLIHPHAYVDPSAILNEGVQVMAGAVIQADACIGNNVIINSRASVDHDCVIGDHVHIAPGAVLCGGVHVCQGAFIGSGATVTHGIKVSEKATAGAGVSVVRDIPSGCILLPASIRVKEGKSE